jgi:hypothetical protein
MIQCQAPVEWQGKSSNLTASDFCPWGSLDGDGVCGEHPESWPFDACTLLATSVLVYQSDICGYKLLLFFLMLSCLRDILYYRLGFIGGILLGAFAELRKAAIGFVIYLCSFICLSVRMEQPGFH